MRTKGAVLWGRGQNWQVEELELDDPVAGEVRVRLAASGLCHSDEHVRLGDMLLLRPGGFPFLGGHEGAGVVDRVGPGVTGLREGDPVVLSFIPACGRCRACSRGRQNLCDNGAGALKGRMIADGTSRVRVRGQDATAMCLLGTFAPYVVAHESSVVKVEDDVPLDRAALVGCGVTTGWGSAVHSADVRPGDTVVVVGVGGIGVNAVQGAAMAGAERVVAIDPVPFKREQALAFGATHVFASMAEARGPVHELTWGRGAEAAVLAVGRVDGAMIGELMPLVGKGGTAVVTGMGDMTSTDVTLSLFDLSMLQKRLQGSVFGGANPRADIPRLLGLYREGRLKLDELVTRTYRLEEINEGYADMHAGRNLRGLVVYGEDDW
ncbi:MAG: NDMA-dependent alcohol dehydrogenase [Actinomycetota bacterium]|nr:NDMA-dependent alcohol dehydrogenase [Actinomycetota bacterium]